MSSTLDWLGDGARKLSDQLLEKLNSVGSHSTNVNHTALTSSTAQTTSTAALTYSHHDACSNVSECESTSKSLIGTKRTLKRKVSFKERVVMFEEGIESDEALDFDFIRRESFYGVPEKSGLRGTCWRMLVGCIPDLPTRTEREAVIVKQRQLYCEFLEEFIVKPGQVTGENVNEYDLVDVTGSDHPLSTSVDSAWANYFKDNEILDQINKDVRRTLGNFSFFQLKTQAPRPKASGGSVASFEPLKKRVEQRRLGKETEEELAEYAAEDSYIEAHWEVLERVLFVYAKLNPGISYVQGMNEILAPIYYVFATDHNATLQAHAEADAFQCFSIIMAEKRDNFIKSLDNTNYGINGVLNDLVNTLKFIDPELAADMEQKDINPQFYAFRWLTLLYSQEFELPDVLRLWDSLFADPQRFSFVTLFGVAMLVCIRDRLLSGDFSSDLKLLQCYPVDEIEMDTLLSTAVKIRSQMCEHSNK